MAAKGKAAKAGSAAVAARKNPYVQRLVEDAELRENIRTAYDSARSAYARIVNGKAPTKVILDDKKLHRELRVAADSLREASAALREGPKRRRRGGLRRKLLVVLVGAGIGLAVSESLRKKVLDALFGAEEDFEYTSTTSPSSEPETASTT